jgi:hypothetical protein
MDDVARALLGKGALVPARELLALVGAQRGPDALRCRALLQQLEAHPHEPHVVPNIVVSAELAASIAAEGHFQEAQIVARTLEPSVRAIELLAALELILAPLPAGTPAALAASYQDARQRADRTLALQVAHDPQAPEELRRRAMMIVDLRRVPSTSESSQERPATSISTLVSETVRALLEHRDWARGERELRALQAENGAGDVLASVVRLREAMARLFEEESANGPSTVPLSGAPVAIFQLRMGNLPEAERVLRRVVREDASHPRASTWLSEIELLRTTAKRSSAPPAAPEWLDKRGRKPSIEGWAPSKRSPTPSPDGPVTAVMRPDEEAELHLRAGRVDIAIRLYEELAKRYPDRPHFAKRAEEIRGHEASRELVFVDELTIRHAPPRKPAPQHHEEPTLPAVAVASFKPPALPQPDDDEMMTFGATEVTSQRIELGAPDVDASVERVVVRNIVRIS